MDAGECGLPRYIRVKFGLPRYIHVKFGETINKKTTGADEPPR